ncbi:hypothetical protein POVWA2_051070 [Plasmodium ovale wallikeri]|uniref:Uncharacterized protein n=1 Tax=Plasmodium ovale wallikeri TaxID=864142 RepID=A0A1A8ZN91_PLAOA|nr:hypothetical protein POVWA1_051800 [Plasmodium ovale wallikeri]SBT45974.1 hypothetical protein POVWA2_051070 [Plasmodium ovale wallikeri]
MNLYLTKPGVQCERVTSLKTTICVPFKSHSFFVSARPASNGASHCKPRGSRYNTYTIPRKKKYERLIKIVNKKFTKMYEALNGFSLYDSLEKEINVAYISPTLFPASFPFPFRFL